MNLLNLDKNMYAILSLDLDSKEQEQELLKYSGLVYSNLIINNNNKKSRAYLVQIDSINQGLGIPVTLSALETLVQENGQDKITVLSRNSEHMRYYLTYNLSNSHYPHQTHSCSVLAESKGSSHTIYDEDHDKLYDVIGGLHE